MQIIGVDSGGTFTDVVLIGADGRAAVGKAPSTPARPADGVLDAIGMAAAALGETLADALAATGVLAHGTTVGVNALLTGRGARTALLTTAGFEDTVPIARINKVHGLEEGHERDRRHWAKPPALVPRERILGLTERVDAHGVEVVALDEQQVRAAVRSLADQGVESVGIALLWSFLDPAHEQRVAELVREELGGDVELTLSSEIAPRIGEYERSMTVVLNSYVAPVVAAYLRDLEGQLRGAGFGGELMIMRSGGGVLGVEQIVRRPIETLRSGPVGGLGAAAKVGAGSGDGNIVSTDVGGTSFEVGLLVGGEAQHARRPMIDRYALAMPLIDIESIGTGGGSIAWLDPREHALKVGPQSAAAVPGPACYGRGGRLPTVTDAAVALGYLERLGGELTLDRAAAEQALETELARPLGVSVTDAAEGVLRVACAHMADLVRRMTVQRGHDPRDFVLYAFGGAAPQYAGRYAADLGVRHVVVPAYASVFSALGAATGDFATTAQVDAPRPFPPGADWLAGQLAELEARVREQLGRVGREGAVELRRRVALRFVRQVHEIWMPLPDGPPADAAIASLAAAFEAEYERQFGRDTAYSVAGIELVGVRVEGTVASGAELPQRAPGDVREPHARRRAWFGGEERDCPVYDGDRLAADVVVRGPAFVEVPTTTTVVFAGQAAQVDARGNVILRLEDD